MKPDIFTAHGEFFEHAVEITAKRQNCDAQLVYDCMRGLDTIWNSPKHLDAVKEVTAHFNEAAEQAQKLYRSLTLMTAAQRAELLVAGCVTMYQVEHLAHVLAVDAQSLADWSRNRLRTGGRNPAAYDVAEMMRRLFRKQRRSITFGTAGDSDRPSTAFGKAVLDAMGDFGVKAGWRRPTAEAFDKQRDIQDRLRQICEARRLRAT